MFVLTGMQSALLIAGMIVAAVLLTAALWRPIHRVKWIVRAFDLEPLEGGENDGTSSKLPVADAVKGIQPTWASQGQQGK
jgi:hypothetical protein